MTSQEAPRPVTHSLTPQRRRENAAISEGVAGKNVLALTEKDRSVATLMVTVTRLLDPRLQLLILQGAGIPVQGDAKAIVQSDISMQHDD